MAKVLRALLSLQKEYCAVTKADIRLRKEIEDLRGKVERTKDVDDMNRNETISDIRKCVICLGEFPRPACVACTGEVQRHFYCLDCFANNVRSQCEPVYRGHLVEHESSIVCPNCAHPHDGNPPAVSCFGLDAVARCPDEVVQRFLAAGKEIVEVRTYDAQQQTFDRQIGAMRSELARLSGDVQQAVLQHRVHISENILNLRCPRRACAAVFADFTGCFAIICGKCNCGFCGW